MQHFSYLGCPLVTHFLSQRKMKTFSQGFFEDVKAKEASGSKSKILGLKKNLKDIHTTF